MTGHFFRELPACVSTYPGQCQLPVHDTVKLVLAPGWWCYQFVSMLSHPSDTCHQCYFHRRSLSLLLSPSPRFSLSPHPSRCQALVHSASPLAPWPGLPSNNFISFPPLSRRPAPPLTIGCCFLSEKKKKSTGLRGAGWEPNNSWQCARHRTVILMAAVGMYGPEVTHKRPVCVCSCRAGKHGTCRLNLDVNKTKDKTFQNILCQLRDGATKPKYFYPWT